MTKLSIAAIETLYNDLTTGQFKDAQAIPISRLRQYVDDMLDSGLYKVDDLPGIFGLNYATYDDLTPNEYDLTLSRSIDAYTEYTVLAFLCQKANTGVSYLDYNGIGQVQISKFNGAGSEVSLDAGDLKLNQVYLVAFVGGTPGPDYYTESRWRLIGTVGGTGGGGELSVTKDVSDAVMLTLSQPDGFYEQLVAAQGADVVLIPKTVSMYLKFGTTAYTGNVILQFWAANIYLLKEVEFFLDSSVDKFYSFTIDAVETEPNLNFQVTVKDGLPADGDSTVRFKVTYETLDVSGM